MKVVFIYGAPGVGKLTTAKELSKLTGFKILHNHLINDLVSVALEWGGTGFWETVEKYRLELLEAAAKSKTKGLILTGVYAKNHDEALLTRMVRKIKKFKGEILFVHLTCHKNELFKRVTSISRKAFKKISTQKKLREAMSRKDFLSDVPYEKNLVIDNTKLSPSRVAKMIQKHYEL